MKQGQKYKKIRFWNPASNQQGQAVVEYVLLLVVIVSMIMAAKGLFSGVNKFIGDYVGNYFVCLMDHGELPQLGVDNSDLKNHVNQLNCKATFSIAGGANLTGGAAGGSSGGTGTVSGNKIGQANATKDPTSTSKNPNSASSKNKRGSGSDDSSGGENRNGNSSAYAKGRIQRSNSGGGTADGASDSAISRTKVIEDDQVAGSAYARRGGDGRGGTEYRYNKYKAITSGQMFDDIQKNSGREQRKPGVKTISKLTAEEGFRPGPRKNAFIPPERKPALETEDVDTDFGFGKLMKWLMIAGMIVAIIVFFGGQIMNYSNSE